MRILIDISHPAHVHFFKNAICLFKEKGHIVKVVSRDKDITTNLLKLMAIEHDTLSAAPRNKNMVAFAKEMIGHCAKLYKACKSFSPDVMLQIAGTFIAPVGILMRCPTVVFYDTEFAKISNAISYPLASYVCTPDCYEGQVRGNHIRYPGYHELAYLHPDVYKPNIAVLRENNLEPDEKFFIIRFVGWAALHDYSEKGFDLTYKKKLIDILSKYGKVLISSEVKLPEELRKYKSDVPIDKIHDVMAFSSLVIGESATMASEAAVLGVPAVFISTTPRGYTNEQEKKFGLVKNFNPKQQNECLNTIEKIASQSVQSIRKEYKLKYRSLIRQKINTSKWIVDFIESQIIAKI